MTISDFHLITTDIQINLYIIYYYVTAMKHMKVKGFRRSRTDCG